MNPSVSTTNDLVNGLITLMIIGFLILVVWSRIEKKSIMEVVQEIKDKLGGV